MVIGVDYRLAASSHRGMGRYCREIVAKLFEIDDQNTYILYADKECNIQLPPNCVWHKLSTANFILGEQFVLPAMMRRDKIDVMWSPSNTFPLFTPRKIKLIVTVHDLIFMYKLPKHQNFTQRVGALYRRWVLKLGRKRVDVFATVSKFSAKELHRIFRINNTLVTYNCIESFYEEARSTNFVDGSTKFYFTLSADAPSKNLPFLLDAFKNKLTDEKLVVGGVKDCSPLRDRYQVPNITFLSDGVPDYELIKHYKSCEAFIYVSLFEGFGIPPLEALACGAKVICSNTTSLPEVIGEHGILIDPTDENALLQAIKEISNFEIKQTKLESHLEEFIDWEKPAKLIHKLMVN